MYILNNINQDFITLRTSILYVQDVIINTDKLKDRMN